MPRIRFSTEKGWRSICHECGSEGDAKSPSDAMNCSQSDSGETLADIMDILKDLMEDMKTKGGRLREKQILGKAFDRYEQHRSTLIHGTSPMLGCTCHQGLSDPDQCPHHARRFSSANDKGDSPEQPSGCAG